MDKICPPEQCTGCFACANICPQDCINMKVDEYGEIHPSINNDICINCGLCKKSCPSLNSLVFNYPIKCYAAFVSNIDKRRLSASGGIGNLISEYTISVLNGVFWGTKYDSKLIPITDKCTNLQDLDDYKGSKYVQSLVGNSTFNLIREYLIQGRWVTYIATPCQVAGLKSFLKKDYPHLITVDLICHGVSPTQYFKEEIDYWRTKLSKNCITNVRFRGNDKYNFCFTLWDNQKLLLNQSAYCSYYLCGFLKGITLRENCYSCKYARPERISDITIGDFIGLGNDISFEGPRDNTSVVIINTEKGENFLSKIRENSTNLIVVERTYEEAVKYGPSLRAPFPRHKQNAKFRQLYPEMGFVKAIRKTLTGQMITYWIHRFLIAAPRKLWRITLGRK